MPQERRVAMITGASRGIGAATALKFAQHNYDLFLTAAEDAELHAVAREAQIAGARVQAAAGDLADLDVAHRLLDSCIHRFGRIDVLMNNAAWRERKSMRDVSVESWERTLRVGLTAPAFLARWAAENMASRRQGVIVNISSIQAGSAPGFAAAYVACKGGLDALTRELAALYGRVGIRVISVAPGAIDTEVAGSRAENDDLYPFSQDMIPLGRWGTLKEVANFIAFVASDDASYLTGATLVLDGGWSHSQFPHSLKKQLFRGDFR